MILQVIVLRRDVAKEIIIYQWCENIETVEVNGINQNLLPSKFNRLQIMHENGIGETLYSLHFVSNTDKVS